MEGMRQTAKAKFGWGMVFLIVLMVGVLIGKGWDRAVMATRYCPLVASQWPVRRF